MSWTDKLGPNPLLRAYQNHQRDVQAAQQVRKVVLESGGAVEPVKNGPGVKPGDRKRLRGIPVVGVKGGLGGAVAGTRPGDGL